MAPPHRGSLKSLDAEAQSIHSNSSRGLTSALITSTGLLPVASAAVHWTHVIGPPAFTLQTGTDPDPPLATNDSDYIQGTWVRPKGHLGDSHFQALFNQTLT